jgi:hypothetical protein
MLTKLSDVRARIGSPLPPTPWSPEGKLASSLKDDTGSALYQILFSKNGGNAGEALIVGGLLALKEQPFLTEATSRKAMAAWHVLKLKMPLKS